MVVGKGVTDEGPVLELALVHQWFASDRLWLTRDVDLIGIGHTSTKLDIFDDLLLEQLEIVPLAVAEELSEQLQCTPLCLIVIDETHIEVFNLTNELLPFLRHKDVLALLFEARFKTSQYRSRNGPLVEEQVLDLRIPAVRVPQVAL